MFRVDEAFNFRTRAERFKQLHDRSLETNTAPLYTNLTMDNSYMPLMTGEDGEDIITLAKSEVPMFQE